VLVLKRERDAQAAGDRPYALIKGSSLYQHGDRPAMAAVSSVAQRRVMAQALRDAAVDPHQVQYLEAQANGSKLGGVIEAEAIAETYRRATSDAPPLYLGSAKANLGYLETASGAAGLIKTALALRNRVIPPQPGIDTPDPAVPWPETDSPMAAVSSFGFTGTHAHVLMEGVADPEPRTAPRGTAGQGRRYWPDDNIWS
jgi:acyl transferase domain-containing protein